MKKINLTLWIGFLLIVVVPITLKAEEVEEDTVIHDALLTALSPSISQAIIDHYGHRKQYGLYDAKILQINRESEGGFGFEITVQVRTFVQAHNPPHGIETITFEVSPSGVEKLDYHHKGDKTEKKIADFYQKTITDIKNTIPLNLTSFTKYTFEQLQYQAEIESSYQTLSEIVLQIIRKELHPEIEPPTKNVIDPVTFIKGDHGYILYKKTDGTNVVVAIEKQQQEWKVVEKKLKEGKKMPEDLLWYM